MLLVPRTCLPHAEPEDGQPAKSVALEATRGFAAYVLLGDPGSGKSKAFEREAAAWGAVPISAGDFLGLDHPELRDADFPVFIDGLDETRAGSTNGMVPLDGIRKKLQQLGCRRFRISCRAADWLGQPDAQRLQSLLADGELIEVFRLQPLTSAEVAAILEANCGIADPDAFIAAVEEHGLTELLFNPQTLEMLAKAVGSANLWPESRLGTYEMACDRLAQEHNQEHAAATRKTAPNQVTLRRAAAYLCVLYLVADLAGFSEVAGRTAVIEDPGDLGGTKLGRGRFSQRAQHAEADNEQGGQPSDAFETPGGLDAAAADPHDGSEEGGPDTGGKQAEPEVVGDGTARPGPLAGDS